MRALIAFLLIALTLPVYAEDAKTLPKNLQPIPEPPPPPAGMELDPDYFVAAQQRLAAVS